MKKLIVCLALIGLSGSVFAQVSCEGYEDNPCVCQFVMDMQAMGNAGAEWVSTDIYHNAGGADRTFLTFYCTSNGINNQVAIEFFGQKSDKFCQILVYGQANNCAGLSPPPPFGPYSGKQQSHGKRLLKDFLDSQGW